MGRIGSFLQVLLELSYYDHHEAVLKLDFRRLSILEEIN